jgi:hypothetical protein
MHWLAARSAARRGVVEFQIRVLRLLDMELEVFSDGFVGLDAMAA